VRQGGRDTPVNGIDGADPAGFLRADSTDTAMVVYCSRPSFIEMPADRFEDYLRLEGLERIVAMRKARGKSAKAGLEYFSRYAKSLLTARHGSAGVTVPIGLPFEIVPDVDPTTRFAPFRGRVLYEGKPLAGALVVAMARSHPTARLTTRTDDRGAFTIGLTEPDVWLIKSVHMIEAGWFSRADWLSLWASFTFDAPVDTRAVTRKSGS
jgi:hypothetical protein